MIVSIETLNKPVTYMVLLIQFLIVMYLYCRTNGDTTYNVNTNVDVDINIFNYYEKIDSTYNKHLYQMKRDGTLVL